MKKQNKLWLLLAASMLVTSLSACGADGAAEETTADSQQPVTETEAVTVDEEQMYVDALPEADFDGEVVTIIANALTHGTISFDAECLFL